MQVEYKNRTIEKVCTNASVASKKYGNEMAEKIHQHIDEIKAADNVEQMLQFHIGRCHKLKGIEKINMQSIWLIPNALYLKNMVLKYKLRIYLR